MSFDKYRRKRHFSFECRTKRSYLEMYSANYAISLITLLVLIVVVAAKNGELFGQQFGFRFIIV